MNEHHTLFEIVTDKYAHTHMTSHRPSAVTAWPLARGTGGEAGTGFHRPWGAAGPGAQQRRGSGPGHRLIKGQVVQGTSRHWAPAHARGGVAEPARQAGRGARHAVPLRDSRRCMLLTDQGPCSCTGRTTRCGTLSRYRTSTPRRASQSAPAGHPPGLLGGCAHRPTQRRIAYTNGEVEELDLGEIISDGHMSLLI